MKGIIGAIAGDIIGSTYEFHPIKTKEFSLFNKKSTFTDDTIMTLAVANWLLNNKNSKDYESHKPIIHRRSQRHAAGKRSPTHRVPRGTAGRFRHYRTGLRPLGRRRASNHKQRLGHYGL